MTTAVCLENKLRTDLLGRGNATEYRPRVAPSAPSPTSGAKQDDDFPTGRKSDPNAHLQQTGDGAQCVATILVNPFPDPTTRRQSMIDLVQLFVQALRLVHPWGARN